MKFENFFNSIRRARDDGRTMCTLRDVHEKIIDELCAEIYVEFGYECKCLNDNGGIVHVFIDDGVEIDNNRAYMLATKYNDNVFVYHKLDEVEGADMDELLDSILQHIERVARKGRFECTLDTERLSYEQSSYIDTYLILSLGYRVQYSGDNWRFQLVSWYDKQDDKHRL